MANNITQILELDIKSSHGWTQAHIDWFSADLTAQTSLTKDRLVVADQEFNALHLCRETEQALNALTCETCQNKTDTCKARDDHCATCIPNSTFTLADRHFGDKWCDLHQQNVPEDCTDIKELNIDVGTIETTIENDFTDWQTCYETCEDWKEKCTNLTTACSTLETNSVLQADLCNNAETDFYLYSCEFGKHYQQKCLDFKHYQAFLGKAWTNGAVHFSEIDRMNEWESIQIIKCVLSSYDGGTREFSKTVTECRAIDAEYNTRVGELDNKTATFQNTLQHAQQTCGYIQKGDGWESTRTSSDLEGIESHTKFGTGKWLTPGAGRCDAFVPKDVTFAGKFKHLTDLPYTHCNMQLELTYRDAAGTVDAGQHFGSATNIYTR